MSTAAVVSIDTARQMQLLERARAHLAEARTLAEVKEVYDKGSAVIEYLKRQRDVGLDAQNDAAEIVLAAERRLGEMLADRASAQGRRSDLVTPCYQVDGPATLADLGISKMQSHRWQTMARVPEDEFQDWVQETRASEKQLTSGALFKLGRQQGEKSQNVEEYCKDDAPAQVFATLRDIIATGRKFQCIYADPPWKYGNQATRASTDNHYQTMSVDDICAEPVAELTDDECHLYLWTTSGFLPDAFRVIDAWGFTYKSNMVWVKPQMGIGNWVRLSHEHLLIAVKGKRRTNGKSQMSWLELDRTKHSRKPREFREIVERMSQGPYLEMYGREAPDGWTVYGNQVEGGLF